MVYLQLAVLHRALTADSVKPTDHSQAPVTMTPATFWTSATRRTWLSTHCGYCDSTCSLEHLEQHIHEQHADLLPDAQRLLPTCVCPEIHCCNVAEAIIDQCPLALNLALRQLRHATLRDLAGGHDDAARRHLREFPDGTSLAGSQAFEGARRGIKRYLKPATKVDAAVGSVGTPPREPVAGVGHSGHVHSVSPTGHCEHDPYFGAVHQELEAISGPAEGDAVLAATVTTLSQQLLERMLKVAQSAQTSEIWQEALQRSILTEQGSWPFLAWNPKERKICVMDKPPLSMTCVQRLLEELVELLADPQAVVRFKCLKTSDLENSQVKVLPWMLQIGMRHQRLHALLHQLVASSVWSLILGRLRPHTVRENPLASNLARASTGLLPRKR